MKPEETKGEVIEAEVADEEIKTGPVVLVDPGQKVRELAPLTAGDRYMHLMEVALTSGKGAELEKIMDLQDRWEAKEAQKYFYEALASFQSQIPAIPKRGKVNYTTDKGQTQYDFGKLEDIVRVIKPFLEPNGLSYRYDQSNESGMITVGCIVTHKAGHSERLEMSSTADASGGKNGIQAIASAVSYMRRYTLTGSFGLVVEGEDNDATGYQEKSQEPEFMSDERFNEIFPGLETAILNGSKTPGEAINWVNDKGGYFSQDQLDKINKVGKSL